MRFLHSHKERAGLTTRWENGFWLPDLTREICSRIFTSRALNKSGMVKDAPGRRELIVAEMDKIILCSHVGPWRRAHIWIWKPRCRSRTHLGSSVHLIAPHSRSCHQYVECGCLDRCATIFLLLGSNVSLKCEGRHLIHRNSLQRQLHCKIFN